MKLGISQNNLIVSFIFRYPSSQYSIIQITLIGFAGKRVERVSIIVCNAESSKMFF